MLSNRAFGRHVIASNSFSSFICRKRMFIFGATISDEVQIAICYSVYRYGLGIKCQVHMHFRSVSLLVTQTPSFIY